MDRRMPRLAAVVLLGAVAASLTGCGPSPWDYADEAPSSTPPVVAPQPVQNDLSSGSTQRVLQAGSVSATVDYWSELRMDRWTPTAIKPLSLSMVTTVTPADGQKVYLQKATMLAIPSTQKETLEALPPQVDQSTLAGTPGFLVLAPYSYSQSFNVGQVPAEATSVTLQFTFDFLVQATPTSTEFAKQTATDQLTIAIAQPAPAE